MQPIIPTADPIPLPAPYWLFKILLVFTFILHIIAMNMMFGGGVIAAITRFLGRKNETYLQISRDMANKIPALLAATITLGIAPLLFVQVLYGQYFYTSSIVMAWPWFLVLILLTAAYYGFYIASFHKQSQTNSIAPGWFLLVSVVLLFIIGFFYSNNFTLMLRPERWAKAYFQDPSGWNLHWQEGTLIPRFLHFMVASIAIGGLMAVFMGFYRWNKEKEYARRLIHFGSRWFMFATMVQIAVGIWFLISLPKNKMMLFMGGNLLGTIALIIGVAGALASIFLVSDSLRKDDPRKNVWAAIILIFVVIVFMSIMRDVLRNAFLKPYYNPAAFTVKTQWDVLILFLVLLIAGAILWLTMIRRYFFTPKAQAEA